jgi:D-glycero-D-manno-heptose 1,7-bisphosphate phosphatase
MAPFVILDRDGVINEDSPEYIKSPEEWIPVDGSLDAIAALTRAGVDVYIATNQAGVARGKLTLTSLKSIHKKMLDQIRAAGGDIREIACCLHHPNDACECRKPRPGMLLDLAQHHNLVLPEGYFVGDSEKDMAAAHAAGCQGVLVLTGNGQATLEANPDHQPVFRDLAAFTQHLLTIFDQD